MEQRIIVGLGNPGKEYEQTRHNVGFDAIDRFAARHRLSFGRISRGSQTAEGAVEGAKVTLLKPMTYMNLSGEPLSQFLRNHPHPPDAIMAVVDDIHLPVGKIRLRPGGSDGGHNGLKSLSAHLQTRDYPRLRIGVGEPGDPGRQVDYVLGRFSRDEMKQMDEVFDRLVVALEIWIESGIEAAMNRFNGVG
jgi:PTH1 family peptidyl-tRNA hydrolase